MYLQILGYYVIKTDALQTLELVVREWNPWSWENGVVTVADNEKVWSNNGHEELRMAAEQNHLCRENQRMERLRYWDHPTCLNSENFGMDSIRWCDMEPEGKI